MKRPEDQFLLSVGQHNGSSLGHLLEVHGMRLSQQKLGLLDNNLFCYLAIHHRFVTVLVDIGDEIGRPCRPHECEDQRSLQSEGWWKADR